MTDGEGVTDRMDLRSGRVWWVPATLVVAWLVIAATPIPGLIGWAYTLVNVIGTGIALRLQVARLEEWGEARPDRRPLLRFLCVAQVPSGWATILLVPFAAA